MHDMQHIQKQSHREGNHKARNYAQVGKKKGAMMSPKKKKLKEKDDKKQNKVKDAKNKGYSLIYFSSNIFYRVHILISANS